MCRGTSSCAAATLPQAKSLDGEVALKQSVQHFVPALERIHSAEHTSQEEIKIGSAPSPEDMAERSAKEELVKLANVLQKEVTSLEVIAKTCREDIDKKSRHIGDFNQNLLKVTASRDVDKTRLLELRAGFREVVRVIELEVLQRRTKYEAEFRGNASRLTELLQCLSYYPQTTRFGSSPCVALMNLTLKVSKLEKEMVERMINIQMESLKANAMVGLLGRIRGTKSFESWLEASDAVSHLKHSLYLVNELKIASYEAERLIKVAKQDITAAISFFVSEYFGIPESMRAFYVFSKALSLVKRSPWKYLSIKTISSKKPTCKPVDRLPAIDENRSTYVDSDETPFSRADLDELIDSAISEFAAHVGTPVSTFANIYSVCETGLQNIPEDVVLSKKDMKVFINLLIRQTWTDRVNSIPYFVD